MVEVFAIFCVVSVTVACVLLCWQLNRAIGACVRCVAEMSETLGRVFAPRLPQHVQQVEEGEVDVDFVDDQAVMDWLDSLSGFPSEEDLDET